MMDVSNLKSLIKRLKEISAELEAEVYSDTDNYLKDLNYDEVLTYYSEQSSAEEGL
jgi:hypothetical protein